MITAVRAALLAAGIWLGWYGIAALLELARPDLISVALWFAAGILVHDAVFAPLCAAAGVGARRVLPAAWWAPVACGAVCTVTLVLVALPVLRRGGAIPDNPSSLDRDYPLGLGIALAVVWALVLTALLLRRARKPAGVDR
ncbi:hypothetical protein [Nocardia harenae]|uniref:hypothetical protein n=1 Tax=Nocardia harenae TaxID=358707 RepID=UPI000B0C2D07|nr:hypothetical protein [Nocardia harenae]